MKTGSGSGPVDLYVGTYIEYHALLDEIQKYQVPFDSVTPVRLAAGRTYAGAVCEGDSRVKILYILWPFGEI